MRGPPHSSLFCSARVRYRPRPRTPPTTPARFMVREAAFGSSMPVPRRRPPADLLATGAFTFERLIPSTSPTCFLFALFFATFVLLVNFSAG